MHAKIAVASNDGLTIARHFGRTDRFSVFEIHGGKILGEELRTGTAGDRAEAHCDGPDLPGRWALGRQDVISLLEDCRTVLCRGMGLHVAEQFVRRGVNPLVIVDDLSPRAAVERYLAGTLKPARGFCRHHAQ